MLGMAVITTFRSLQPAIQVTALPNIYVLLSKGWRHVVHWECEYWGKYYVICSAFFSDFIDGESWVRGVTWHCFFANDVSIYVRFTPLYCHVKWQCILVNVSWNWVRHLLVALKNRFIKLNEGKPLLGAGLIHSGVLRPRKLPGVIWRFCVRKSFSLSFTKINSLYPLAYWLSELWNACAKGLGRADVASVSKRLSVGH